ncbi:MAG: RIP metalloprotease RseP [Bacteroidota bacterium]|jgi:regulator of sigma E protease|nr:RIP metalloprotease RseP [Bacteroidota bacterium]
MDALAQIFSQVFYFIIIIGVLVLIHELGHFLAAKAFGMRVERFSIGFPPRAFGKQIGDTDYCISWLPIGGYVKISGMIDESMDTEHLQNAPEPYEFRAKPVWQRIIVIVAGVVMNLLLAIGIFWGLNLSQGMEHHRITTIGYVQDSSLAANFGLQPGDDILAINDEPMETWEGIREAIVYAQLKEDLRIAVRRDGERELLRVPQRTLQGIEAMDFGIAPEGAQTFIAGVEPGLPASRAGMKEGDVFLSIDDKQIHTPGDVIAHVSTSPGRAIKIVWTRGEETMSASVIPTDNGKIGVIPVARIPGPVEIVHYGVFEALGVGVTGLWRVTDLFLTNIYHIIIGEASFKQSIGGPVKIAEMAAQSAEAGLVSFLSLMALLSISLAIINIFPIPALDGGHLIFLIYEGLFRREVPNKIKIALQQVGMVLLLALMVFVIYNDIF